MDQLMETLVQAVAAVASAGITALAVMAIAYFAKLRKKAEAEIDKIDNESTQTYLNTILDTTYDTLSACIDKIEVTLVKQLKEASADGKLTKEDQERAAQAAIDLFKDVVNTDVMNSLTSIVGDTEKYLLTLIDSIVLNKKTDLLKNGVNPAVTSGKVELAQYTLNS